MTKHSPTFEARKELAQKLPQLSERARSAFAAACAQRVLPLALHYRPKDTACQRAIDVAWRFGLGEDVPQAELEQVNGECEALMDGLYDEDLEGWPVYAVRAAWSAVGSVIEPQSNAAKDAAGSAHSAVNAAFRDEALELEELEWELDALEVARTAVPVNRGMFNAVAARDAWLKEYRRSGPRAA